MRNNTRIHTLINCKVNISFLQTTNTNADKINVSRAALPTQITVSSYDMVTSFFRLHFHNKTITSSLHEPRAQITILQAISSIMQSSLSYMHKLGNSSISDRIMIYQKIGKTTRQ